MKNIQNILLFICANAIGFMAAPIAYHASILSGWFSPAAIETDPAVFQSAFFSGTIITWIFCAVLSLGFFIAGSKLRIIFLLIPALVPAAYGLSVLNEFVSSAS